MQLILGGIRGVDTFFLIGGLLLSKTLLSTNFCTPPPKKAPENKLPAPDAIDSNGTKETSFSHEETNQEEMQESKVNYEEIKQSSNSHPIIDLEVWNEVKAQGAAVTLKIFLKNYCLYVFNRIVR